MHKILPQVKDLSLAKVRLIARLKGDGCVYRSGKRKTNYWLKYEADNPEEIEQFAEDIRIVYGVEPKFGLHRSGKNPNKLLPVVFIRSKQAYEDVMQYGPFSSREWRIPDKMMEMSRDKKVEFMRVFAEDEGTITNNTIKIYSINVVGLNQLICLLNELGIEGRMQSGYGHARNVFAIVIAKKREVIKFRDAIGFRSNKKNEKLAKSIKSFKTKNI